MPFSRDATTKKDGILCILISLLSTVSYKSLCTPCSKQVDWNAERQ